MNYQKRRETVFSEIVKKNVEAFVIASRENVFYLSGFTGSRGFLLLTGNKNYFITDSRYTLQAHRETGGLEIITLKDKSSFVVISDILKQNGIARLAFEAQRISHKEYLSLKKTCYFLELVEVEDLIEKIREIKDSEEIERIAKAQQIAEEALAEVLPFIKPGVAEKEIALELEYRMQKKGAEGVSFPLIVASGWRSAMPHGQASAKHFEAGDLIVIDFGCKVQGYCSDMTRTFALGKITTEQRKLYETVKEIQKKALAHICEGVIGSDVQAYVQKLFDEQGYGEYFGHGLGHSVGIEIHESPRFSSAYHQPILKDVCITVEPGLYMEGVGGVRIEDIVVVDKDSVRNLNHFSKELMILN